MDHLPRAKGSFLPTIEIPLYVKPEHNWEPGSKYSDFVESKGFSNSDIIEGKLGNRSKEEVLSVVQAWAFFGTIISVCEIAMVPLNVNDFIHKSNDSSRSLTTAPLTNLLRIWIYQERQKLPNETRPQRAEGIRAILSKLSKFINEVLEVEMQGEGFSSREEIENPDRTGFYGRMKLRAMKEQFVESGGYHDFAKSYDDGYYERNQSFFSGPLGGKGYEFTDNGMCWKGRVMSPSHLLILSLAVLGEAMEVARSICYGRSPHIHFSPPMFLNVLLQVNGWCPVEVKRVTEIAGPSMLYYLTSIDRRSGKAKHMGCCHSGCVAFQITDSTYKGKHVTPDCKCEYVSLESEVNFIKERVDEGSIPLVFLPGEEGEEDTEIGITAWGGGFWSDQFPFVAISHIWADGIGNTEANAVPACQLYKLQRAVNDLYPEDKRLKPSVPFWIDTLLVPLEKEAKAKAITRMEDIYRCADKVLVFDASLEAIEAERDPQELMMRIYLCPWMSRLWTLQEAFLARALYFKFSDRSLRIKELARTFRHKLLEADKMQFQNLHHSGEAAEGDADVYDYPKALDAMLTERLVAFVRSEGQLTEHDDEQKLYPVWRFAIEQLMFLRLKAWDSQKREREFGWSEFAQMTMPMHYRASSKSEDEPLCLALLAGAPVSFFLQLPPDCRMEQLFGQFNEIPGNIIFSEKQRIHKPARKWIPQSLLNASNFYSGPPAKPTPDGLLVRFGGIVLGPLDDNRLFPCRHTSPDGLFYLKHGSNLILCKYESKHYGLIPEGERGLPFGHDPGFGIETHSDVNYQHWSVQGSYAAIIFDRQKVLAEWRGKGNAALVTTFRQEDKEYIRASFEVALKLEKIRTEAEAQRMDIPGMSVVEILDEQLWCVG